MGIGAPLGQPLFKPVPTTVVTTEQLSGQMAIGGPSPTLVDVQQSAPPVTPGAAAAPLVTAERPDVMVLDVIMPHKNGYQVCRQVKSDAKTQRIKIILLTKKNQPEDYFWGMQHGADAYLTKPFQEAELLATVAKFV